MRQESQHFVSVAVFVLKLFPEDHVSAALSVDSGVPPRGAAHPVAELRS